MKFSGPLDCTISDFWHMAIQEETDSIIMLCLTKEKGMDKVLAFLLLVSWSIFSVLSTGLKTRSKQRRMTMLRLLTRWFDSWLQKRHR
jgi:protein tyrosine phosphatase